MSTNDSDMSFMQVMQDVKPLDNQDKVVLLKPQHTLAQKLKREALQKEQFESRNTLSLEHVDPVDPYDQLSFVKPGVQEGVFKNLRLGKYPIEHRLMLNKMTVEQARQTIFESMQWAQQKGIRAMLIRHGIGEHNKPFPAVMKSFVNRWLTELPQVLAYHSAQHHHGGLSAVYVLLKKSEQSKAANRELHRKK